MKVLLTGATGFIGRHLLAALTEAGHQVVACIRNPEDIHLQIANIECLQMDFTTASDVSDWLPHLQDVEIVINTVGIIQESGKQTFEALHTDTPSALFEACYQSGIQRVVQLSALGAEENAVTKYHQSKFAADDVLTSLPLDWFIIRPSIVMGEGAKSMGLFSALASLPVIPVVNGGQQMIQPVAIDDLVTAVMRCLEKDCKPRKIIEAAGNTPVIFSDVLQHLRRWLGKHKAKNLSISLSIALKMAPLGRIMGDAALNKSTLLMLESGNTANVDGFEDHLGKSPLSLESYLAAYPASQAQRWHSGLYFLRPLLTFSIAFLWIWTGIVSAFLYPQEDSYTLLKQAGISGVMLPIMLYGAAIIDVVLGVALLIKKHLRFILFLQASLIVMYTVIISITLPEYWLHPYGAISKNLPLLVTTLILIMLEEEKP